MRVLAIADDDSLVGQLGATGVDLMLCLGDLWDSSLEKARERYAPGKVFGVRGNHDSAAPFPPFVESLHLEIRHHGALSFAGFGGSWRYKPRGHHLFEQEEVSLLLRDFPRVDVFIAHNSPRGVHERDDHVHQGFDGFSEYIDRTQPRYFIHGHQHLRQRTWIGCTEVIGIFGEEILELG